MYISTIRYGATSEHFSMKETQSIHNILKAVLSVFLSSLYLAKQFSSAAHLRLYMGILWTYVEAWI